MRGPFPARPGRDDPSGPRTVVVLGPERGGTSMVARALAALGLPMGAGDDPTGQDPALTAVLARLAESGADPARDPALTALVAARDAAATAWGFKAPGLVLPGAYALMRRPRFVAVYRDPAAVAVRAAQAQGRDVLACLAVAREQSRRVSRFLAATDRPLLVVSYEAALDDPRALVAALDRFAGTAAGPETLGRAASGIRPSPEAYVRHIAAHPVYGRLERVDRAVRGWAMDPAAPGRQIEVDIFVDGRLRLRALADAYRQDLGRAGVGDGRHGFFVPLPSELLDGRPRRIDVRLANRPEARLLGSPAMACPGAPHGVLERADATGVAGWAFDPVRPERRPSVVVRLDGREVGRVAADLFRDDLLEAGIGDGRHGFALDFDEPLAPGRSHRLEAVIDGADATAIEGGSATIGAGPRQVEHG